MKKSWIYAFVFTAVIIGIVLVSSINLDLNHDGSINIQDLQLLVSHYEGKVAYNSSFDLNNDSKIDLFDVVDLAKNVSINNSSVSGNVSSAYPHQPAGYSIIVNESFSTYNPSNGAWNADGTGIMTNDGYQANVAALNDTTAPQTPPGVIDTTFPSGLKGGTSPASIMGWDQSYEHGTEYKDIYFSMWLKIPGNGTTYQAYGGVNKFGFFGYAGIPGSVASDGLFDLRPDVQNNPQEVTHLNLQFQQQNNVYRNIKTGHTIDCGAGAKWHHWEVVMKLNSAPGVADGVLEWWQDGVLVTNQTNMVYITTNSTHGFYHWKWDPVWGGGSGPVKNQTDHVYIDHVYISGILK